MQGGGRKKKGEAVDQPSILISAWKRKKKKIRGRKEKNKTTREKWKRGTRGSSSLVPI